MFKPISDLIKSIANDPKGLILNRYKLKNLLGQGAMGEVYCAEDTNLGNTLVAIKFLSHSLLDEKMRTRFEREAKISALLGEQSLHIVKVKDYGLNQDKIPFYVMELLRGYTLDRIIKKQSFSVAQFLSFTRQMCLALECAHNGILVNGQLCPIIHRDIKPSNIFVIPDTELGELIKILDFGIAQVINPLQSGTQTFMGTPEYCSPEQMAEKELDNRSDIYSLGITMYEMLTKEMPIKASKHSFKGWLDAHHQFTPKPLPSYLKLPEELEKIIMQCLAKSPEDRPQSIADILKIITPLNRQYNADKPISYQEKKTPIVENLSLQEIYRKSTWPINKPQKKIVFPLLTENKEGKFASLWTMLEKEEIKMFDPNLTFCYSHFLFQKSPHPMILWINLLYIKNYEPKWLPSYLDLKTNLGYNIVLNLIQAKIYHILLFELEKGDKCQEILNIPLSHGKIQQLEMYLEKSSSWKGQLQPLVSKQKLKQQFEQIKDTILVAIQKAKSN